MNIISFPISKISFSHSLEIFNSLGFEIIDNGPEGSYVKLPEGWHADYQYHTPFEFYMTIFDDKRCVRAYATLLAQTASLDLISRYRIINYKPWLSPDKSELRLIDNTTKATLFSQNYIPKLIPNKASTALVPSNTNDSNESNYETAYNNLIKFCNKHNININDDNPLNF